MLSIRRANVGGMSVASRHVMGTGIVIGALALTLIALLIPVRSFGGATAAAAPAVAAPPLRPPPTTTAPGS